VAERLGLPKATPHVLRHLHASILIDDGLPITAVAARLGHANSAITHTIYAHRLRGTDTLAADAISRLFADPPTEDGVTVE
jgi:integrase